MHVPAVAVHMLLLPAISTMPGGHRAWLGPLVVRHWPDTGVLLSGQALGLPARQWLCEHQGTGGIRAASLLFSPQQRIMQ